MTCIKGVNQLFKFEFIVSLRWGLLTEENRLRVMKGVRAEVKWRERGINKKRFIVCREGLEFQLIFRGKGSESYANERGCGQKNCSFNQAGWICVSFVKRKVWLIVFVQLNEIFDAVVKIKMSFPHTYFDFY